MEPKILSIRGMNIVPADKVRKHTYFSGEHFEGMGNKWESLYENPDVFWKELSEKIMDGNIVFYNKLNNKSFVGIMDKNNSPVSTIYTIEQLGNTNEFISACPVLKGINHDITLKEIYTWGNGAEGEMATVTKNGKLLNFHNPFYPVDVSNFRKNKIQTVSLSGLVYSIDKLEEKEFTFNEGSNYEILLQEFLKENPNKTEKDFVPPILKTEADTFRMFCAKDTTCVYEIVGQIEDINFADFNDTAIAILKVNLERKIENEYFHINLYV
ncbi:MAG: hypothetical protein LUG16_03390, partial [Candidatus Gastranaerophilales bacterium]|nr:hypothetical protein [Candidatus Gastranaerophilales bacterium]